MVYIAELRDKNLPWQSIDKMSGDGIRSGSGKRPRAHSDENLPLAEPDAVEEVPSSRVSLPRTQTPNQRPPDATEASEPPGAVFELSAIGEEITEGQLIDDVPIPGVSVSDPRARSTGGSDGDRKSESEPPEARIGKTIAGRYRVERLIAKGGMGRVYLATQIPLERQVAIKLLVNQRLDAEFRKRFFLEASICAKLVHRHIVTVHDYGEAENGELFMAMEYLDGVPLSKLIQKQVRLPSERACKIALQVCRALRAAHKSGVVHRDLKPGNVIVLTDEDQDGNDFIKVLDFGLVKAFEGSGADVNDLTKSGTWLGSPRYMAPEQIRCQPVDPRTDIYSLGVILFHMLAGRPPFIGANSMEVLEQHLRDKPPSISDVLGRSDYAPELEVIIERCLRKEAGQRYQSMDELIGDLKAAYRLITGVSLHTESTLPTFAEISDPSAITGFPSLSGELPRVLPPTSFGVAASDALSVSTQGARVTGTIRAPLELLESTSGTGRGASAAMPYAEDVNDSIASFTQDGSLVVRSSTIRWAGLASVFLLVMLAGFFSVKLFAPRPAATVKVRVDSRPRGAEVLLDGRRLGVTPVVFPMPGDVVGTFRTFIVRKEGHEDVELSTQLQGEQVDLHAALIPLPPPAPPPALPAPEPNRERDVEPAPSRREIRRRQRPAVTDDDEPASSARTSRRARDTDEDEVSSRRRRRRRRDAEADRAPRPRKVPVETVRASSDDKATKKKGDEAGKKKKRRSLLVGSENDRVVKESDIPVVD